jgi:hypothetical protein
MIISFHEHGRERLTGALFMSSLESVRGQILGAKLELEGYTVDGIAVREGKGGRGLGGLVGITSILAYRCHGTCY